MNQLFEIQKILLDQFEKIPYFNRECFRQMTFDNRITAVLGSRGVGKTSFLLHFILSRHAQQRKALYVSADNIYFLDHKLFDLVDQLYKETDVRLLCIDEVHKYPNWNQELKNIADTYLEFRIVFTGSSMIDLIQSKYDLSRRVTTYYLHGFSFREYLEWQHHIKFPHFGLEEVINSHHEIVENLALSGVLKHLHEYFKIGYYPFFREFSQEREKYQAIENVTLKTIYEDIGTLHSLKTTSLQVIEKLFKFVIHTPPGELSAFKLAKTLEKDYETIVVYLNYLKEAGLIRFLYPQASGKATLRPSKMFPENPNLIYANYAAFPDNHLGKVRETFVINQLQNAELDTHYTSTGDVRVNDFIFEIGGRSKKDIQIKGEKNGFLLQDGILTGSKKTIPLYLIGFLY